MFFHKDKTEQIDDLLNRIGEKLQLNKVMQNNVSKRYNEVYKTLDKQGVFEYDGNVYPQGSYALQTTVKPLGRDDFDLDVVIQFDKLWSRDINSKNIIDSVVSGLCDKYEDIEPKNRCVRINFDDFHLDVVPAFPYDKNNKEKIMVPNVETNYWKESCPKGYISWFENKCMFNKVILEKCAMSAITQEKLTEQVPYEIKPPLKIAVQLAKRYRDVYFENRLCKPTPSIIITTLFATYYDASTSEFDTINNILDKILKEIHDTSGTMEIRNPMNHSEIISECWSENRKNYDNFCGFIVEFKKQWNKLGAAVGFKEVELILESMFKENIASKVIKEQAQFIADNRETDNLAITSTGIISSTNIGLVPIKKNNFFGE